ncbi:hypothetical protein [Halopelagius fulvigenes]|uniref:Major facilitator superfamily (MFS) profile domain-containing protein n=1 Tax=Halopelagius fulvigenes TaxID=1198324 RepID=A0ABD5TW81_9EURY
MATLRERFERSDTFRRGVIGAVSGALAGVTLTLLDASTAGDYFAAIFIGAVAFVALWLLTS